MSVLVSELIQGVRDMNTELTVADQSRIIRWLNNARRELQNHPSSRHTGELGLATRIRGVTAGESLYALPCDYITSQAENSIFLLGTPEGNEGDPVYLPLAKVSETEMQQPEWNTGAYAYALQDDGIRVSPTPTVTMPDDGMQIVYYRSYGDWVDPEEVIPDIWDRFRECLEIGAALRSGIRYEDDRNELERLYQRLLDGFRIDFESRDGTPKAAPMAARRSTKKRGLFGTASRGGRWRTQ